MAAEKASTAYAAIVAEAEAAVAAVKDPELRRVAFDRILTTLLDAKPGTAIRAKGAKRTRSKPVTSRDSDHAGGVRRGPKGYVEELLADGFFEEQRTIADVKTELANRGHHVAITSLSGPLQSLTQQKQLRRQKITATGDGKSTFAYSNW